MAEVEAARRHNPAGRGGRPATSTRIAPRVTAAALSLALLVGVLPAGAVSTAAPATVEHPFGACQDAPSAGFADVTDGDPHAAGVDCLRWWRIADGFGDDTFRPSSTVTRGQMATFLTNTVLATDAGLPATGPGFEDTTGSVHATPAARLAAAGLAAGFGDGTFRPSAPVTRGQMAAFLDRLLDHLDVGVVTTGADTATFDDVNGTQHAAAIRRIAALGIAEGDGSGGFGPAAPVTRGQMASFLARTLEVAVDDGIEVRAAGAAVDAAAMDALVCPRGGNDVGFADALLEGRYRWSPHPEVELGTELTWTEDPLEDANWRFQFHALRWVWYLISATQRTGDERYLDHAYELVRSWVEANPRDGSLDPMAWNDHSAAWRARVMTCLARQGPTPGWLEQALVDHAVALADPTFYVHRGNHALNQDTGLLVAACHLERWQLRDLAMQRIDHLARTSVDAQGVTNEQAVEYQVYNHNRYRDAARAIAACGRTPPAWVERIDRMPEVLAHMTLPDGTYESIGDTDRRRIADLGHPATTWLHSGGTQGAPPAERTAVYDAGFYLTRSGWGSQRPLLEETFLSARFGPPRTMHGHDDHGALTLFAEGQRLLVDPGKYRYGDLPEREHIISAQAHNLVTVDGGCRSRQQEPTPIDRLATDGEVDRLRLRIARCEGHRWTREVAFRLADGAVVVVDRVNADTEAEIVQRWQLEVGAEVTAIDASGAEARWPSGASLRVEQHTPMVDAEAVAGGTDPLRGWVSRSYAALDPAPNLTFSAGTDRTATFVTVLRPGADSGAPASAAVRHEDALEVRLPHPDQPDGAPTVLRFDP